MYIEKNHNHIFNNKSKNSFDNKYNTKKINDVKSKDSEFNFWKWLKGAVNPLQNLPIISGIYSSLNSENSESDRDMIQSSGGGFLYGGPIGAIAGFGTWVFRKIFDKTPTELALDTFGLSKIWKSNTNLSVKTHTNQTKIEKVSLDLLNHRNFSQPKHSDGKNSINKNIKKDIDIIDNSKSKIVYQKNAIEIQYPKWRPNIESGQKSINKNKMKLMYNSNSNVLKQNLKMFSINA